MPKTLIEQNPAFDKKVIGNNKLAIAEMFCDTLQGEGITTGVPSTFIRLQGCTLKCVYCDTLDVWPHGNEYSFDEIFQMFEENDLIPKYRSGEQHIILTGGSPLKQEKALINFLDHFKLKFGFKPIIQVENECVLMPSEEFAELVDLWNNSPKLANSGMKERARIKPEVLKYLNSLENSFFKFVITKKEEWEEITKDFISPGYINKDKIILMPEGQNQQELLKTRELTADLAVEHGVRFTDRLHITIWDKKTGV